MISYGKCSSEMEFTVYSVTQYVVIVCFMTGPHHCNIYVAPKRGVELIWWSVGDGYPQPTLMPRYVDRPHYFLFYSYGTFKDDFQLIIDVQVCQVVIDRVLGHTIN